MSELMKVAPYSKIRFYQILTEEFGEQGKNAFFIGFHLYAFRKGIRCAQRAVSKGLPLNYDSYQLCREAIGRTLEAEKEPSKGGKSIREIHEGEAVSCIYSCGTADCFKEFDAPPELEELYCRNVDRMMMYSYNPYIGVGYEVTETFCTSDHCEHHCKASELSPDMPRTQRTEYAPPLAYLTWSSYVSLAQVVIAIFGEVGKRIAEQVKHDIIQRFGMETWMQMEQYKGMDLDTFYRM